MSLPSLPNIPRNADAETRRFLEAVKEIIEVRSSARGAVSDRFVTVGDLAGADLVTYRAGIARGFDRSTAIASTGSITPSVVVDVYPVKPTAPTASITATSILFKWSYDRTKPLGYFEVFRAIATDANNGVGSPNYQGTLSDAVLVDIESGNMYVDQLVTSGQAYLYWVRSVGPTGLLSDYSSVNGTLAIAEPDIIGTIAAGSQAINQSHLSSVLVSGLPGLAGVPALQTALGTVESDLTDVTVIVTNNATAITNLTTTVGTNSSSITTLNTTTGNQATAITNLTTDVGTNSSSITTLNTTTGNQATALTNLTTTVGTNSSSIATLNTTTGTQATALTNLTTTVGTNTSSITTLNTTTGNTASSLTSLESTLDATYIVSTSVDGNVAGFGLFNSGTTSDFQILADRFSVTHDTIYARNFTAVVPSNVAWGTGSNDYIFFTMDGGYDFNVRNHPYASGSVILKIAQLNFSDGTTSGPINAVTLAPTAVMASATEIYNGTLSKHVDSVLVSYVKPAAASVVTPFFVQNNVVYLNTAVIEDASITNAKLGTLSADSITTGTLDASAVTISNLTVDVAAVSGSISDINSAWSIIGDSAGFTDIVLEDSLINQGFIDGGSIVASDLFLDSEIKVARQNSDFDHTDKTQWCFLRDYGSGITEGSYGPNYFNTNQVVTVGSFQFPVYPFNATVQSYERMPNNSGVRFTGTITDVDPSPANNVDGNTTTFQVRYQVLVGTTVIATTPWFSQATFGWGAGSASPWNTTATVAFTLAGTAGGTVTRRWTASGGNVTGCVHTVDWSGLVLTGNAYPILVMQENNYSGYQQPRNTTSTATMHPPSRSHFAIPEKP